MTIHKLVQGHQYFKKNLFALHEAEFIRQVQEGQQPNTLLIGCSDSRFMPELLTSATPGQFFAIRNIGNLVPTFHESKSSQETRAALEFALAKLKVNDIIVCGHSQCGACAALQDDNLDPTLQGLNEWLALNNRTKRLSRVIFNKIKDQANLLEITERLSILCQIENLLTYPLVQAKVIAKELFLHGWYYQIDTGNIEYYDSRKFEFRPLEEFLKK